MPFSQVFRRVELAFFTAAPTPKSWNSPWKKRCPGIARWLERRHFWPWSSKKKKKNPGRSWHPGTCHPCISVWGRSAKFCRSPISRARACLFRPRHARGLWKCCAEPGGTQSLALEQSAALREAQRPLPRGTCTGPWWGCITVCSTGVQHALALIRHGLC